jgi:hypothetical protein
MRPVGDPRGLYLPRTPAGAKQAFAVSEPTRVAPSNRWLGTDFVRPGFSPATLRYTSMKEA